MKMQVNEVCKLTGLSARSLHYYDEIGLLKPSFVAESGYRYYDEDDISTLQQIMFFRELEFPLKEVKEIMSAPSYDKKEALKRQRQVLLLKQERLNDLIKLTEKIINGDDKMSFKEFDMSAIEAEQKKYAKEVKDKWGNTQAYAESQKKHAGYGKEQWKQINDEANEIFKAFSEQRGKDPSDAALQKLVERWREHIGRWYYECTPEILSGLGEMYVLDERFKRNIDKFGEGTAETMSKAIAIYCKKVK